MYGCDAIFDGPLRNRSYYVANLTAHFDGVPHDATSIEDRCGKFRNQGSKGRRHDN